jgi:hypothetical protein
MRFQLEIYDHYLSDTKPIETKRAATFKEALKSTIEIMAIDLSADRIMIFDNKQERFRANLFWNEDTGEIDAHGLRNDKKILAKGENEIMNYFLRRSK